MIMMTWFVFTAVKDGQEVTGKIPAETWELADAELRARYTNPKMLYSFTIRYENGYWYRV